MVKLDLSQKGTLGSSERKDGGCGGTPVAIIGDDDRIWHRFGVKDGIQVTSTIIRWAGGRRTGSEEVFNEQVCKGQNFCGGSAQEVSRGPVDEHNVRRCSNGGMPDLPSDFVGSSRQRLDFFFPASNSSPVSSMVTRTSRKG